MKGRTHLAVAIAVGALLTNDPYAIATCGFSGLIVDIDSEKSIVGRKVPLIPNLLKHRGFVHSIPFMLFLSSLVMMKINRNIAIFFMIGYATHLLLDTFTKTGIKFFIFDKSRSLYLSDVTTMFLENVLFVLSLVVILWKMIILI